jgi:hypothetical protein
MSLISKTDPLLLHADRFYIGGEWVAPSSDATIEVSDSATEEIFLRIAEASRLIWRAPPARPVKRSMRVRGRA